MGCASAGIASRERSITGVQADLGLPDAISDRSGDLLRLYTPTSRPADEWPAEAPRTLFYLQQNLAITFVSGMEISSKPIDPDMRREIESVAARHSK